MATNDEDALDPVEVAHAIHRLVRLAATWAHGRGRGDSKVRADINETMKTLIRGGKWPGIATVMANLPIARSGRHMVREQDVTNRTLVEALASELRTPDPLDIRDRLSDVFARHRVHVDSTRILPRKLDVRAWVVEKRGPIEAAKALIGTHFHRAHAHRTVPEALKGKTLGLQQLRVENQGSALGGSAPVTYLLRAMGFPKVAIDRAVFALKGRRVKREETDEEGRTSTIFEFVPDPPDE